MTQQTEIKRRPDGSIDTAHYMARGRIMRSEQAHGIMQADVPAPKPRSLATVVSALFGRTTARA